MPKQQIRPEGSLPTSGYSTAIRVGSLVFTSGLIPVDPAGEVVAPGNIEEQALAIFRQIEACAASVGSTRADIVKLTAFLPKMTEYDGYKRARAAFFADVIPPASTAVEIKGLLRPEWLVEIEAVIAVA